MKKYADGGLAEAEEQMMGKRLTNPYEKKKNQLPSENISSMEKVPRPNIVDRATELVKGAGKRLKDNVMGTEKQNKEAAESLKRAGYKAGGSIKSSASKRADGCAQRGKTRGKMV
jgi:hypothetical protein